MQQHCTPKSAQSECARGMDNEGMIGWYVARITYPQHKQAQIQSNRPAKKSAMAGYG